MQTLRLQDRNVLEALIIVSANPRPEALLPRRVRRTADPRVAETMIKAVLDYVAAAWEAKLRGQSAPSLLPDAKERQAAA